MNDNTSKVTEQMRRTAMDRYQVSREDFNQIQDVIFEEEVNYSLFTILEDRTDLDAHFMGGVVTNEWE